MKKYLGLAISFLVVITLLGINTSSANAISYDAPSAWRKPDPNFFKFPFPTGRVWRMSGGPHPYNGATGALTSIDFKPAWHSGCSLPNNNKDWVVAAAAGTVVYDAKRSYVVRIDHHNGWVSEYMHLDNVQVKNGNDIKKDQKLGYPACKGGQFTGAHVHFTLFYKGVAQSIIGAIFEGWEVQNTGTSYEGCLLHQITGQKVCKQLLPVKETPSTVFRSMRTIVDIRSVFSNKVLTTRNGSKNDMADIIQSGWTAQNYQKWYLIPLDGNDLGYYLIQSVDSGKCFDIRDHNPANGGILQQYSCNNYSNGNIEDNRKFKLTLVSGRQFYIQVKHSGLVLDIPGWSQGDVAIQQFENLSQDNQHWVLTIH